MIIFKVDCYINLSSWAEAAIDAICFKWENDIERELFVFCISHIVKHMRPGQGVLIIHLSVFAANRTLCVASLFQFYVMQTESLHHRRELFISFKQPHKAVGSQNIMSLD